MLEVLLYLRDNACKIYIVTDGGQGFVYRDEAFRRGLSETGSAVAALRFWGSA
jgi:hypothetical protein